jgi:hypothetical protein
VHIKGRLLDSNLQPAVAEVGSQHLQLVLTHLVILDLQVKGAESAIMQFSFKVAERERYSWRRDGGRVALRRREEPAEYVGRCEHRWPTNKHSNISADNNA